MAYISAPGDFFLERERNGNRTNTVLFVWERERERNGTSARGNVTRTGTVPRVTVKTVPEREPKKFWERNITGNEKKKGPFFQPCFEII